jgi:hypothetical protein
MTDSAYSKISGNLYRTFNVTSGSCEHYNNFYNERLLPRIWEKYLAHLIASIAEIIDEKMEEDGRKKLWEDNTKGKVHKFSITLVSGTPLGNANAESNCFRNGVVIKYKPNKNRKELRIFIAHELGHVLSHYGVLKGNEIENYANVFAFLAISGRNDFYKDEVKNLVYEDDNEIIHSINELCPIKEIRQDNATPLIKQY